MYGPFIPTALPYPHQARRLLQEAAFRAANRAWVALGALPAAAGAGDAPHSLARLERVIGGVRLPYLHIDVAGWLSLREQQALYALAYTVPGPILEIGAWVGRSTACLAYGIRDSGRRSTFVSVDLNVTPAHFRPYGEGVGFFYPTSAAVPLDVVSAELYRRDVEPVLRAPGGVLRALRENLTRLGLRDLVQIVNCDLRAAPRLGYRLIFCDVTHTPAEIERNLPHLAPLLTPGAILACHDTSPANEACLRRHLTFRHTFTRDSLFVGELAELH